MVERLIAAAGPQWQPLYFRTATWPMPGDITAISVAALMEQLHRA